MTYAVIIGDLLGSSGLDALARRPHSGCHPRVAPASQGRATLLASRRAETNGRIEVWPLHRHLRLLACGRCTHFLPVCVYQYSHHTLGTWRQVLSFIMTECVETLGTLLKFSPLQAGMVFSAAGTSFPNVFASMVVAKQGLGNMAISNALGGV